MPANVNSDANETDPLPSSLLVTQMERKISISRQLRPIRFGFLSDLTDMRSLERIVQANTLLWGGMFNPIIPCGSNRGSAEGYSETVGAYINVFKPDFLVTSAADQKIDNFPEHRVISLDTLLRPNTDSPGLPIDRVYSHLFDTVLSFRSRRTIRFSVPPSQVPEGLGLIFSAIFGSFSDDNRKLGEEYRALGEETLEVQELDVAFLDPLLTAIDMTAHDIDRRDPTGTIYMVLDPRSARDVVDFWNMRASGLTISCLPASHWYQCVKRLAETISVYHGTRPPLSSMMTRATILKSRDVSRDVFDALLSQLSAPPQNYVVRQQPLCPWDLEDIKHVHGRLWYPVSEEDVIECSIGEQRLVSFDLLVPKYRTRSNRVSSTYANVIRLRDSDYRRSRICIPPDFTDLGRVLGGRSFRDEAPFSFDGGIVVLSNDMFCTKFWKIPNGTEICVEWMALKGISASISHPGRVADDMMQMLGQYANPYTLTRATRDVLEQAATVDGIGLEGARVEIMREVSQATTKMRAEVAERRLKNLVEHGALSAGCRVVCTHCERISWHALEDVGQRLRCPKCLVEFWFPSYSNTKARIGFRARGPFATGGKGAGAYAVVLAAYFLRDLFDSEELAFSSSLDVTFADGAKGEIDFFAFWRRDFWEESGWIAGECKTRRFEAVDIERMRVLAQRLGPGVLMFVTLDDCVNEDVKEDLRKLATWGREGWRNPVLILTWRELEGDRLFARMNIGRNTILRIAAYTQCAHLGLDEPDIDA